MLTTHEKDKMIDVIKVQHQRRRNTMTTQEKKS